MTGSSRSSPTGSPADPVIGGAALAGARAAEALSDDGYDGAISFGDEERGVVNGAPGQLPRSPLVDEPDGVLPADLRLQILTTEHWSLLSTRALTWNEAFSRASMFLSVLTGSVLALALVAGVMGFDGAFVTFALVLLPVVLFAGVGTFRRLIEVNREDMRWVVGMNRLRYAYLQSAPELRPYFVTGLTDDEAGIMTTFGARPGPGSFAHEFVTTPGLIAVVDGVVAGVLVALVGVQLDLGTVISFALGSHPASGPSDCSRGFSTAS